MKEYIVHRGFRPYRENSIMSFMISDVAWYEMDLLYVNNRWYMCHDYETFNGSCSDLLIDFWKIKKMGPKYLLDIKWNTIYNAKDDYKIALNELHKIIDGSKKYVWVQFSDPYLYEYGSKIFSNWKRGYIVSDPIGVGYFQNIVPDFFMLDMYSMRTSDISIIRDMYPKIYLIGYTCTSFIKKHPIILKFDAIVCDICVTHARVAHT